MREAGGYKTCTKCRVEKPIADFWKKLNGTDIVPLAKGGSDGPENIQLLCAPCNRRKSAKDPIVFMQENGFLL